MPDLTDGQYQVLLTLNRNEITRPASGGLEATLIGMSISKAQPWTSAKLRQLQRRGFAQNIGDRWRSSWRITIAGTFQLDAEVTN